MGVIQWHFLDEVHTIVDPIRAKAYTQVISFARDTSAQIVLCSGTVTQKVEILIRKAFNFQPGTVLVRPPMVRPTIGTHVFNTPNAQYSAQAAGQLMMALRSQLKDDQRILIFFSSIAETNTFAEKHGILRYHSEMNVSGPNGRNANMHAFTHGRGRNRHIACTSILANGVDDSSIAAVIIVDPMFGLTEVLQEAGRCGRGGIPGDVYIIASPINLICKRPVS